MGEGTAEREVVYDQATTAPESSTLEHAVVETEDGTVECTLFPRNCEEEAIVTHWLTAAEDSFVALDVVR